MLKFRLKISILNTIILYQQHSPILSAKIIAAFDHYLKGRLQWVSSIEFRTEIGIPIIKITRSHGRLIFIIGVLIPGRTVFILRPGPGHQALHAPLLTTLL